MALDNEKETVEQGDTNININVDTPSNDEVKDTPTDAPNEEVKSEEPSSEEPSNEEPQETPNEEEPIEEDELTKLKKENEQLKLDKLNNSLDFMSASEKEAFTNLDMDLDSKSKMVDYLKTYRTQAQDNSLDTHIVSDNYDDQFDENGDVKLKDLQDLLKVNKTKNPYVFQKGVE